MFEDLAVNLAASGLHDFGKAISRGAARQETVQAVLKQLGAAPQLHDFPARYVETLVELRLKGKSKTVLGFFREESIMQVFFNYYYGKDGQRFNKEFFQAGLQHCIAALQVGDAVTEEKIDVAAEVQHFWQTFQQKVQESRSVKEVEMMLALEELKTNQYHLPREHKAPHTLTIPPLFPEVFLGREEELQTLKEKLFSKDNILILMNGQGGIGKSTLAAIYYHTYQNEYTYTAWVVSEKNIGSALLTLAEPLGLRFEKKMPIEVRLEKLITAMANLKKPCLLIIDNANERNELEKYYHYLRRCSNFHILLTTRITEFQKAQTYRIDGLPENKALELFKQYYPQHTPDEDGLFKQIYTSVAGNTLVIELLAKNLRRLNRIQIKYTLTDLLADLQSKGLLALSRTETIDTDYQKMHKENPEAIISAMYELGNLSTEERRLLSIFSVLPAESISYDTLQNFLPNQKNLDSPLLSLTQNGWLEFNETQGYFKISPVVQEIVKKKNDSLFLDCLPLINTLNEKLRRDVIHEDNYKYASVYSRYAEVVARNFELPNREIAILCERIGIFHQTTGNLELALYFFDSCRLSMEKLHKDNPSDKEFKRGLAVSLSKLGETYMSLGNLDKALSSFEKFNQLMNDLYEENPENPVFHHGLAVSFEQLGKVHMFLKNFDQALILFKKSLNLSELLHELYPSDEGYKRGVGWSHQYIGNTLIELGDIDTALNHVRNMHSIFTEVTKADPKDIYAQEGLGWSNQLLGNLFMKSEKKTLALEHYQEMNKIFEQSFKAYPQNVVFKDALAISFAKLGEYYQDENNKEKARQHFQKAATLWEELVKDFPYNAQFSEFLKMTKKDLSVLNEEK